MTTMILSPLAVAGIGLYQRRISPYKGFRCAYGAESGFKTCSAFGKHVFARYDVTTASAMLRRRFAACRAAYIRLKLSMAGVDGSQRHQRRRQADPKNSSATGEGACSACESIAHRSGPAACEAAEAACDVGICDIAACSL